MSTPAMKKAVSPLEVVATQQALPKNNGAFDTTTLWRLWEAQSILGLIREAASVEFMEPCSPDDRLAWALKGVERLLDNVIRRGGENTALNFDAEE